MVENYCYCKLPALVLYKQRLQYENTKLIQLNLEKDYFQKTQNGQIVH